MSAVLPRCTVSVTVAQLCYWDTLSGSSGGSSYLCHYENYRLIDWLIAEPYGLKHLLMTFNN